MKFYRVLLVLALLVMTAPAQAAEVNAEGAAKLKTIFQNFMLYQKSVTEQDKARLEYDGNVMVEPADKYYAVTLPHVRMLYPDGAKLDIGMVSINASPHETSGQWKMAVAIPTPIILMDARQTQAVKINIGAQKAAGIWDEGLEGFAKLDAEYNNITVENAATGLSMKIPEIKLLYDFAKNADNTTWSGPGQILVRNVASGMANGGSLKLGELKIDFSLDRYNPAVLNEYHTFLQGYMADVAKSTPGKPVDQAKTIELADRLRSLLINASNGLAGSVNISGLEATRTNPLTHTPETVRLDKAFFGLEAKDMSADKVTLALLFGHDGLSITPTPAGYDGVIPEETNIDIKLNGIPAKQLLEMVRNTLQSSMTQPEMANFAGMSLLIKLPAVLSQAGTNAELKNTFIGNSTYRFDINGIIKADVAAVNMFIASLKGKFRNLDTLVAKVKAIATDLNHPAAKNAQGILRSLQTLQTYGAPKPGVAGTYTYDLQMSPQGQVLLNGKPSGLGMIPATPPAQ